MNNSSSGQTRWFILGAGAIGSLWAHWLGENAQVIVKENSANHFHRNLIVEKIFTPTKTTEQSKITCIKASQIEQPITQLLICTKAHQTLSALENLNIDPRASLVILQNGLGVFDSIKDLFPQAQIFSATTTHGAYRKTPTHIIHAGKGNTWMGSLDSQIKQTQIETCIQNLTNPQEKIISDAFIEQRLWKKLAINCAINPLTMIHECRNGELIYNSQYHLELKKICQELDLVLKAKKILNSDESILETVEDVAAQTAHNFSSMLQDRQQQRSSEIDYIQGYLCQQAIELDIAVPEIQNLYSTIKKIEAQY